VPAFFARLKMFTLPSDFMIRMQNRCVSEGIDGVACPRNDIRLERCTGQQFVKLTLNDSGCSLSVRVVREENVILASPGNPRSSGQAPIPGSPLHCTNTDCRKHFLSYHSPRLSLGARVSGSDHNHCAES
jgi:hypothetical protein